MALLTTAGQNLRFPGKNTGGTYSFIPPTAISKDQYISIVDIISEGPIEGPPFRAASVYLDNAPAATKSQAGAMLTDTATTFTFNGTDAVTANNLPQNLEQWLGGEGTSSGSKYLQVRNFASLTGISAVRGEDSSNPIINLTAASAFFEDYMLFSPEATVAQQAYITLELDNVRKLTARIISLGEVVAPATGSTTAVCEPVSEIISPNWLNKTNGEYSINVHVSFKVKSHNEASVTLEAAATGITATLAGNISNAEFRGPIGASQVIADVVNQSGFSYQFRRGHLFQGPISDIYTGAGSLSITSSFSIALEYPDEGLTWPTIEPITDTFATQNVINSDQLNLSTATASEVDMVKMVINYPGGLIAKSAENLYDGMVAYKLEVAVDKGAGFTDESWKNYIQNDPEGEGFIYHVNQTSSSFHIQTDIDLSRFKPFKDFKLRITRASREDQNPTASWIYDNDNQISLGAVLTSMTCVINEKFVYPYTAYAQVRVNAKVFESIPQRSYECKGKLIQVPSNYVTRDESINGEANYKRIPSTGVIHATDEQDWDGNFKAALTYTNNPAWVFYDIITNNRYGLGTWIETSDIDKYALYRIARYCDELVPDGKGSQEPRFTANIYLTKATEAYKVLKDFATTFRGILYWSEGNIMPVIDQAKDPVYTFTKGNVINGAFNYESTGSKLRSNQVAVTWNNPDNDYVPEALLVEDRENIIKTGKIITEESVAFGCTSEGQATRYGRWKLWTAINQSEVVSFTTAMGGIFLGPGDVINIQDADRYDVAYSGRISKSGTAPSTTTIPLDRTIILNLNSTYNLSVLIQEPAAFLAQDAATIDGDPYVKGDMLPASLYTDEESASNIQDDSENLILIVWAPHTHIETQEVETGDGSTASLTVDTAFSNAPEREGIWALQEIVDSSQLEREGSKKIYRILGITESKKNEFSITAVEHFNEKFDAIEGDFGRPYIDTVLAPAIVVPPITHLTVTEGGYEPTVGNFIEEQGQGGPGQ